MEADVDMKLVFIHGAPAVGKLSVARELATLTGFRLFHNHLTVDLVSSVFPFGSEPFVLLREQVWLSVFSEAAKNDVSVIFTFNPESTVRARFIEDAVSVVESAGGQIYFVELSCSQGELERRIEDPSRKEFGKLCSIEQYRALAASGAFSFRELPSGLTLDTTNNSPSNTAALIEKYLSRGLP
jgi:chloramphenicol 3-O-phosphotransferase